ncbi:hypothetical protein SARC_15137, partial [Sphaeroforma arctica JP610]
STGVPGNSERDVGLFVHSTTRAQLQKMLLENGARQSFFDNSFSPGHSATELVQTPATAQPRAKVRITPTIIVTISEDVEVDLAGSDTGDISKPVPDKEVQAGSSPDVPRSCASCEKEGETNCDCKLPCVEKAHSGGNAVTGEVVAPLPFKEAFRQKSKYI